VILSVAILQDSVLYMLPKPARHSDVIFYMADLGLPIPIKGKQGFLDSGMGFVDREQAVGIAKTCGQIVEPAFQPRELFSEDLW
jgi:hypothetical protein